MTHNESDFFKDIPVVIHADKRKTVKVVAANLKCLIAIISMMAPIM